jgi:hypothetical protein
VDSSSQFQYQSNGIVALRPNPQNRTLG